MRHVLILGGTGEGIALARKLHEDMAGKIKVTSALAGVTAAPAPILGDVRVGGFGGAQGLANYIRDAGIDILVDVTHPFAAQMAAHAAAAAEATATSRLKVIRPMWRRDPRDHWIEVPDLAAAAAMLPKIEAKRAFLTVGGRSLRPFAGLSDIWFLARTTESLASPLPLANAEFLTGRGPFQEAAEIALMRQYAIDVLATKASGGTATEAKIKAARALDIPVVIVRRPTPPKGEIVDDIDLAITWIEAQAT